MALIKTDSQHYTNIATKIREKTGGDETYTPSEMAEGVEKVFEAGKKAEYDAFWDIIQNFGNRTDYANAFAYQAWSDETFKPKYDIKVVGNGVNLFRGSVNTITDLEAALERAGVVLDTSGAINLNNAFTNPNLTSLPTIDMTKCTSNGSGSLSIQPNTITIRKIISSEGTYWSSTGTFRYAYGLVNLIVEGVIGRGDFSVQWSTKLSKDSIVSIINALSTETSGLTLTLSKTAVNNVFEGGSMESEWLNLIATKPNWTISLA